MADLNKAGTNDEVHGYDALDRLDTDAVERATWSSAPQRGDSAYDQLWLGEESFYLMK